MEHALCKSLTWNCKTCWAQSSMFVRIQHLSMVMLRNIWSKYFIDWYTTVIFKSRLFTSFRNLYLIISSIIEIIGCGICCLAATARNKTLDGPKDHLRLGQPLYSWGFVYQYVEVETKWLVLNAGDESVVPISAYYFLIFFITNCHILSYIQTCF